MTRVTRFVFVLLCLHAPSIASTNPPAPGASMSATSLGEALVPPPGKEEALPEAPPLQPMTTESAADIERRLGLRGRGGADSSTATEVSGPRAGVPVMKEVVVTASRYPTPRRETPDSISVVTHEEIRATNASDLAEAAGGAPGVELARQGGRGSLSSISVRGVSSPQVLVLVDGRPLNQAGTGMADLSQFSTAAVDRVEIVRGPSSLLYGSSAIGAVVNVITPRPPRHWEGFLDGQGGSFGTEIRRMSVGGPLGPVRFRVEDGGTRTDGYRPNGAFEGEHVMARAEAGGRTRLSVTGEFWTSTQGLPGSKPPAHRSKYVAPYGNDEVTSLVDTQRDDKRVLDARLEVDARGGHHVSLRHFVEFNAIRVASGAFESDPFGWPDYTRPATSTSRIEAQAQGVQAQYTYDRLFGGTGLVTTGAEWRKDHLETGQELYGTVSGQLTRTPGWQGGLEIGSEFWEGRIHPLTGVPDLLGLDWGRRVTATGGARHDRHSVFGSVTNPHAGLAVDLGPAVLMASVGTSFRAPALNDLFWRDPYMVGNPHLRPEKGRTAEVAVEAEACGATARLGCFKRSIHDQIDWGPDATGMIWTPTNVGLVRTQGFEAEAGYRWRWVRVEGNASLLRARQWRSEVAEYDSFGAPVFEERERDAAQVPKYTSGGLVGVDLPTGTDVSMAWRAVGRKVRYFEDNMVAYPKTVFVTKTLKEYAVLTLRVSQRLGHVNVYAGIENLADAKYASRFGSRYDGDYPAPPRTWFAGASMSW